MRSGRLLGALNGIVGEHIERHAVPLGVEMRLVDEAGEPVARPASGEPLKRACVLLHGHCATEAIWTDPADESAAFGALLEEQLGYRGCYLRYNTGLRISANGQRLSALLDRHFVDRSVDELILIGHSMGGLVAHSAATYGERSSARWRGALRRIVMLGAPLTGAHLERAANVATLVLRSIRKPTTRSLARLIELRSAGIKDLRHGHVVEEQWRDMHPESPWPAAAVPLAGDVRHLLVSGTFSAGQGRAAHVLAELVGDGMVHRASAQGRAWLRRGPATQNVETVEVAGVGHAKLATAPAAYDAIHRWLSDQSLED
jgi:pimeloyl-ACP methyl ester carboxylesterase